MHAGQDDAINGLVESGSSRAVEAFASCPASVGAPHKSYLKRVRDVARWSERHGFRAALVHADNRLVDPWVVSQVVVQSTRSLGPLVTVQPAYQHPFTVANMIVTFSALYARRLFINWVASGSKNDLAELGDDTPHEERYDRLIEFASIVRQLTDGATVTFKGEFYEVRGLKLRHPVEPALRPEFMVSGSSPAGRLASQTMKARSVTYALPPEEDHVPPLQTGVAAGLRLGVIARTSPTEAWRAAYTRFSPDRRVGAAPCVARKVPDSHWRESMYELADQRADAGTVYWTQPFENYQTLCPYLVGSHEQVSSALSRYVRRGFGTFILDAPENEADLDNTRVVLEHARRNIKEAA